MEYDFNKTISDVLFFEEDHKFSKKIVTVADTHTVGIGEVLGKVTGSGEYAPLDPGAADGTEVASVVAVSEKVDASGTQEVTVLVRHCIVIEEGLVFPDAISAPNKATAIAQLEDLGIVLK